MDQETHNEETRPNPSHFTPDHAQKRTSFTQSPFERAVCPVLSVVSKMLRRPQNWTAFDIVCASSESPSEKFEGIALRTGKHVEHGYD